MLLLGVDTSGKHGSIALVRFEAATGGPCSSFEALDVAPLAGGSYSAELIPQLSSMLARCHVNKSAMDAYAVASGPGSFTGLRVGLSAVKALADAMNKPIAAVTVLEAVAWKVETQGRILVVLDAGRKQLFTGEFLAEGRLRTPLRERLLGIDEFAAELSSETAPVFTPQANIAEALGGRATVVPSPQADLYARIGAERILAGHAISPAELDANYIRRSDAEIFFKP